MNNPLKIYSGSNALLYTTPVNIGCRRRVSLMTEDSVTIKFADKRKLRFPVGASLGDYYITKEQQGKYNATTGCYDYELKFDAYYWLWANKLLFYVMPGVTNAPKETSFKLTATIDVHAAVILRCLNALGIKYDGSPFRIDTDEGFSSEAKYISYANMSVLGGIQAIAEAYECEWRVVGNAIHLGKCNDSSEYDFTVGENVASITPDSKQTAANRLIIFGSTRNLPPNYRQTDTGDITDAIVTRRLMLPEGTPYLQTEPDIPENEIVEEEVVLDSVYPRTALTVSEVVTYESTASDGTKQTFYRLRYGNSFPFSKDYILPDEELHITFESGDLNGMHFAVKFNPLGVGEKLDNGSWNPEAQMFEIVVNEDYGRALPDDVLHPATGDKFSLYGWDATKMSDLGLIAAAEQELLTEGNKLVDEYRKDKQTYTCPMMWDWCKARMEANEAPVLGSVVNLHFVAGDAGRKSRIIGFEHDLDIPYSNVTYICGEKVSVSRLKTLESKVEGLTHDGTKVKIQNSLDFLSKRYSDRTPYALSVGGLLTAENGIQDPGYVSGTNGAAWGIDKAGNMGVESIDVRSFMRVMELVVNRQRIEDADSMLTEGDTIESVEELDPAGNGLRRFRLRLHSEWEGYRTAQVVNNVLRGIYNDITDSLTGTGTQTLHGVTYATSWMLVTSADPVNNTLEVTLYADADCPAGANFAPVPLMKIARWGNAGTSESDRPRQRLIYFSSTEGRIVMRDHVTKPMTDERNMEVCLGTVPEFLVNANVGVGAGDYGLYVKTLIAERIVKRPHGGLPEPVPRYRGPYDPTERYYDGTELREETGDYERSLVTHMNCLWACAAKSAVDADGKVTANTEPTPGGTAWILDSKHPVYTENLLANSDFSRGQEGWTKWQRYALSTGEKLELIGSDDKTWGRVSLVTQDYLGWYRDVPATAGRDYTLSVLARGLSGTMKMAAYVWFMDAQGKEIAGARVSAEPVVTQTAARYAVPFTTPAGAEWISLRLGVDSGPCEVEFTEVKLEDGRNAATAWTPNAEDLRGADGKDGAEYMLQVTPATVYVRADGTAEPSAIAEVAATVNGAAATPLMWADMTAVTYTGYEYLVWGTKLGTGAEEPTSPQLSAATLAGKYSSLVFRLYHRTNGTRGPVLAERVVTFNKEGARGQTGAYVPPPRPYSDYPDGYVFLDGETDVTVGGVTHSGRQRLDVILVWDAAGNKYVPWSCVKSHVLDRNLTPSSPAWDTYWASDGGTWTQIATQVLLAQNAYIKLLASRGIRIYDAEGRIVGELGSAADASPGQGVDIPLPFWLGGVLREDGSFDADPVHGVGADGTLYIGGIDTGKRIRISGVEKKMEVYDETGRRVVTIDGNAHEVSDAGLTETFYPQSQINGSSGNAQITASGDTANTVTVTLGTVKTPAGGAGKYTLSMDAILTAQTRTYISGYIQSPVVGGGTIPKYAQITSAAKVRLAAYKGTALVAYAEAQVQGATDPTRTLEGATDYDKRERIGLTFDVDANTTYTIKATYTLTPAKVTYTTTLGGASQTAEATASAEKRPVTYHVWTPPTGREESFLGSNGMVVMNSAQEFMRAGVVQGLGFVAEAQSHGNGFRVTPDGLQTKTGGNGWQSAPVTLCAGKLDMRIPNWRPDGVDSCISVNGNAPALAVTSEGEVEIMGIAELAAGASGTFEARNLSVQATIAEPYQKAQPATLMARYDEKKGSVLLTCLDRSGNIMRQTTVWVEIKLYPHARRGQLKQ